MNKKKRTRYIIIGIVILIIGLVVLKRTGVIGKREGTEVEIADVSRQTIVETVNASGKVQPEKEVKISADISGEIIELLIREGDHVKKGQLLARIKPDEYERAVERGRAGVNNSQANLANSRASLEQSKANFQRAKLSFDRNKKLYEQKAISQSDYENAEVEYKVAEAQLEGAEQIVNAAQYSLVSARATLQETLDQLKKTAVYAPIDGTVSRLDVELGERVVGTMQMAGTEMMRIANLANMEVEVEVNENDIVRLSLSDTAIIEIDAYRGEKFQGIVTEIASSSRADAGGMEKVTNFIVKIKLLESSYKHLLGQNNQLPTPFRPGMSATVAIQTSRVSDVLAVPILAVTVRDADEKASAKKNSKKDDKDEEENQDEAMPETSESTLSTGDEVVFIYKDGKVRKQVVKTGIQDDTFIQITEGLKGGEKVVSGPYHIVSKRLTDGMDVSVKEEVKNGSKD